MIGGADAVLFDLDGCLVDSRVPFVRSINAALKAHGLAQRDPDELVGYIGPPIHGTLRELAGEDADEALLESLLSAYRTRYREHAAIETPVFDGIRELVDALAAAVPLVVATTKAQALAEPLLEALDLRAPFRAVIGTPLDLVEEPKTVTVARALRSLPAGIERAVMVGDRSFDVVAARGNGLRSVGVLWGAGSEAELVGAGADALAAAPADLLALID